MVGTKEPIARADEHNRHPNIVEVRIPNLLRRPPEVGLVKHITLIIIDVVHAETKKRTQLINLDSRPVGDPGEGPGGAALPSFLDQTEARRAEKREQSSVRHKKIPEALPYVEGNILDSHPRSYFFCCISVY